MLVKQIQAHNGSTGAVKIPDINFKIPVYALKTEMHFSPASKLQDKINSLFI